MAWYSAGTVSVTNNSTTVTGSGTAWVANVQANEGIWMPDGRLYEIVSVNSNTSLTISPSYLGTTQGGQVYRIVPVKGYPLLAAQQMAALISTVQGYVDGALAGRFANGTVGAPGISFVSNTAMGIYRVAANQLGFVTNGVRRVLLTTTEMRVDLPVTGAAVQGAPDDASVALALLKQGSWGLGASTPPVIADIDDLTLRTGFYKVDSGVTAGTLPLDATVADAVLILRGAGNQITQIYSVPNTGKTFIRKSLGSSNLGAWQSMLTNEQIVGTVIDGEGGKAAPQSAILERGSNANGEYTKFADGTLECWATITTSNSAETTWTFPAVFALSAAPVTVTGLANGTASRALGLTFLSDTVAEFSVYNSSNARTAGVCRVRAIGRWK